MTCVRLSPPLGCPALLQVLNVQQRMLPEANDAFAERVKSGMTWEELDAKLREGVNQQAEDAFKEKKQVMS